MAKINYVQQTYADFPSTSSLITSARLNHGEAGTKAACDGVDTLNDNLATIHAISSDVGAINAGGYLKSGRKVTVTLRLTLAVDIEAGTTIVKNLPVPVGGAQTALRIVDGTSGDFMDAYVSSIGAIVIIGSAASGHIIAFSVSYISES